MCVSPVTQMAVSGLVTTLLATLCFESTKHILESFTDRDGNTMCPQKFECKKTRNAKLEPVCGWDGIMGWLSGAFRSRAAGDDGERDEWGCGQPFGVLGSEFPVTCIVIDMKL